VPYRFATDDRSYADLASGRVLRSRPGQPAFPARLAREMFEQALALRSAGSPPVVYDPCCGAGHLLATVGLLSADRLAAVIGSDVDPQALALARENLRLLEAGGLLARAAELEQLHGQHGNPAHREALDSTRALSAAQAVTLPVRTFQANALDPPAVLAGLGDATPDIVLADLPYGRLSAWQGNPSIEGSAALLAAFSRVLRPGAVMAIATSSDVKVAGEHFHRRRQLKLGKRRVTWLIRDDRAAGAP
jgi:tRNA G10  N-methylase Trm11